MKTTYLILVLGLLFAAACSLPVKEDESLEDELLEGSGNCSRLLLFIFIFILLIFHTLCRITV